MSRIRCICDTQASEWTFVPVNLNHNYCDVEVVFTDSSDISKVTFGITVLIDGTKRYDHTFPKEYAYTYAMQDDYDNTIRVDYPTAKTITINTWAKIGRKTHKGSHEFARPEPPQPFPSWTLIDGKWRPPVENPDNGNSHRWDEETLQWIEVVWVDNLNQWQDK